VTEPITSPTFTLVHSYPCPGKVTLHHADLYRLDRTGDVDDLALNELASFGGIVIVEWGDVAAAAFGDHLEVRLAFVDDDEPDDDEPDGAGSASATDDGTDDDTHDDTHDDTDGAGDTRREIELHATGRLWAGRWDRLTSAVAGYRC
jgi:tRNA threonylcarbamoyladenosine biosynthesis protein TsaE